MLISSKGINHVPYPDHVAFLFLYYFFCTTHHPETYLIILLFCFYSCCCSSTPALSPEDLLWLPTPSMPTSSKYFWRNLCHVLMHLLIKMMSFSVTRYLREVEQPWTRNLTPIWSLPSRCIPRANDRVWKSWYCPSGKIINFCSPESHLAYVLIKGSEFFFC